jgi:subtilase family serine protease
MKKCLVLLVMFATVSLLANFAPAQVSPAAGRTIVPPSTLGIPGLPHTNVLLFVPEDASPAGPVPRGETPASIACIYRLTSVIPGCPINGTTQLPPGGSRGVALVDYGHYPQVKSDLDKFSTQFGLPIADFQEVCIDSCPDNSGTGWDLETALDIQWAHAMAPNAKIFLVESGYDLFPAVQKAAELVAGAGGGQVSNSWVTGTSGEPPNERQYDHYFKYPGVSFFAASGDWGVGALYPSASPFVISAGGTTIKRDGSGNFAGETCWSASGGGISKQEPRPAYQDVIKDLVGNFRGTPDFSADSDPASGVAVYITPWGGWVQVGGTSAASPILAGIVNAAGFFLNSSTAELRKLYKQYADAIKYQNHFRDIKKGSNGIGSNAKAGWDTCTGIGSDKGYKGK